jgi:hypothetical protein
VITTRKILIAIVIAAAGFGLPDADGAVLGSAQKTRARTAATARWGDRRARY